MTQETQTTDSQLNQSPMVNTPFVEVTKEFDAPVETIWEAWTNAEKIKEWWGPENFTAPSAETDFKIDGKYLFAMKSPEGQVLWSTGVYTEIFPMELIVYTDQFADEQGHPITPEMAGMSSEWRGADTCLVSIKFEKIDEAHTKIQLVHEGIPESMHDECVDGWTTSLDKMKKLVEKH